MYVVQAGRRKVTVAGNNPYCDKSFPWSGDRPSHSTLKVGTYRRTVRLTSPKQMNRIVIVLSLFSAVPVAVADNIDSGVDIPRADWRTEMRSAYPYAPTAHASVQKPMSPQLENSPSVSETNTGLSPYLVRNSSDIATNFNVGSFRSTASSHENWISAGEIVSLARYTSGLRPVGKFAHAIGDAVRALEHRKH